MPIVQATQPIVDSGGNEEPDQSENQIKWVSAALLEGPDHTYGFLVFLAHSLNLFLKGEAQLISEILSLKSDFSFTFLYLGTIPEGLSKSDTYLI